MASLSLREAAEQAGTSKSTIWRAIKSGRLSAARTDDGGFAIDPAELCRVFQPQPPVQRSEGQDATGPATAGSSLGTDEVAIRLAALDAEVKGLRALLDEVRSSRDEIREDRDQWRGRAERLLVDQRRPWWKRAIG
jgi:excisionase family DNA binding protein